jgi:hypothetical protein
MTDALQHDRPALEELAAAVRRWRDRHVNNYWLNVSYMGPAVNRFGDHDLTVVDGRLWHLWDGRWRRVERGSDYWLFSVPGTLAWARDVLTRAPAGPEGSIEVEFDEKYGFVWHLRVQAAGRDANNFTFDVRRFAVGRHPAFEEPPVG